MKQAAVTDPTNNGPNGNVDLHFRMDVGPGSVTQALKDAAPASEEEPVIFELPPFTSKDHAGRFVLAFHKQATKEGLVHFRPPGGSMAVPTLGTVGNAIDPSKPPSRPGSAPPQTQPPTQAGSQQQQQQQQRVLQQQRSLDQARAQAREMLIHQGGMSNS